MEGPLTTVKDCQGLADIGIDVDGSFLLFLAAKKGEDGSVDGRVELAREGILLLDLELGV